MIPFARMLEYGNILPPPMGIKQYIAGFENLYIVNTNNELWVIGLNTNGAGCLPQGSVPTIWTKVLDNVDKVYCPRLSNGAVLVKKIDNTWVYCGSSYITGSNTGTKWVFTDITTQMQPANNYRDNIVIGVLNIFYVDELGNLYAMGTNTNGQCGTGNTTALTTFTQVNTNVKKVSTDRSSVSSVLLKNDGSFWGTGKNDSYQLGFTSPTSVNVWTASPSVVGTLDFELGFECLYVRTAAGFFTAGKQFSGQVGNGQSNNNPKTYSRLTTLGSFIEDFKVGVFSCIVKNGDGYYIMGQDGLTSSAGASVSTPTLIPRTLINMVPFSTVQPSYYRCYGVLDNKLYGSGARAYVYALPYYPNTANVVGLQKLTLP